MTEIVCKRCGEDVLPFGHAYGGIAIVDREPNATGSHVLVGRLLLELVPDGEPLSHGSGRIHRSKARGLIRYALHKSTCSQAARGAPPNDQKKTAPTPIRERPRYGR